MRLLLLCLALLLGLGEPQLQQTHRRLLLRPAPDDEQPDDGQCRNTVQGSVFITDDRGFLCTRDEVDSHTGCCKAGQQHSCDKCTLADKCCSEFESCVSCCLGPAHDASRRSRSTLRFPSYPRAGNFPDAWEYCLGVCRTHKASTLHENAYISARHHCFSALRKPMLSAPLPPDALSGVTVLMSGPGQSCEAACKAGMKRCSEQHLDALDSCDRLREQVGCEAGCEPVSATQQHIVPAYIDATAPKAKTPTQCLVSPGRSTRSTCEAREEHAHRLCPCVGFSLPWRHG